MTAREIAVDKLRRWHADPVAFVRECLRAEPDEWQVECLQAVAAGDYRRFALKASKGPGKSTLLSWVGWWFLCTRAHAKCAAVSISGDNLRDGLWSELAHWMKRSPELQFAFTFGAERIYAKGHPETWFMAARQYPKTADAAKQADTLAGFHGRHVLFLCDEAGGMPDAVVATAEAGLANADKDAGTEALLVIAGNPTELAGPLYRACTRERKLWWVKEISGDPDDPKRAKRVSIEWAREQIDKYGRNHPWVLINVFGQFPPGQSNTLIGVEDCTQAAARFLHEKDYRDEPKVLGIDVARFGDDCTVLFPRQGKVAFAPKVFRNIDTMQVVGQVSIFAEKWKPDAYFVDVIGIGAGVVDRLKQLGFRNVIGVDSGARAVNDRRYINKRIELWETMAQWLKTGGCIPNDPELLSQLPMPTYGFDPHNRLKLESKEDMKARGLASPDLADALAFTFAAPVVKSADAEKLHGAGGRVIPDTYKPFGG